MNEFYPLRPFRIANQNTLCRIMRQWPLATLMSGSAGNADISLIPMITEQDEQGGLELLGHLDMNNEHAASIKPGAPISFQFKGPDAYASPDLYADQQLPGWLYISVKGDGVISSILDSEELKDLLCEATRVFADAGQAFSLQRTDERFDQFMNAIRGFRIQVTQISGIAKLAQDKSPEHARQATDYLLARSNKPAADLIEQLLQETLPG